MVHHSAGVIRPQNSCVQTRLRESHKATAPCHEPCQFRLRFSSELCNFEQSAHFGQCMIVPVRPGSHGLVSVGNIDIQTLTTALSVLDPQALSCAAGWEGKSLPSTCSAVHRTGDRNASVTTVIDGMASTRDRVVVLPVLAV